MQCTELIGARVTRELKQRFRALAQHEQISESALLKRVIEAAVLPHAHSRIVREEKPRPRGDRFTLRLAPDDVLLLEARADARRMAFATYASCALRSHLRGVGPLPLEELKALRQSVAELSAVGRNLNQIARHLNQGGGPGATTRQELLGLVRVCEGLRDHTKALIQTNTRSWEQGYAADST